MEDNYDEYLQTKYAYLMDDFDEKKLRVADLRSILSEHNVSVPAAGRKADLLELFHQNIVAKRPALRAEYLSAPASAAGIVDAPKARAASRAASPVKQRVASAGEPKRTRSPSPRRVTSRGKAPVSTDVVEAAASAAEITLAPPSAVAPESPRRRGRGAHSTDAQPAQAAIIAAEETKSEISSPRRRRPLNRAPAVSTIETKPEADEIKMEALPRTRSRSPLRGREPAVEAVPGSPRRRRVASNVLKALPESLGLDPKTEPELKAEPASANTSIEAPHTPSNRSNRSMNSDGTPFSSDNVFQSASRKRTASQLDQDDDRPNEDHVAPNKKIATAKQRQRVPSGHLQPGAPDLRAPPQLLEPEIDNLATIQANTSDQIDADAIVKEFIHFNDDLEPAPKREPRPKSAEKPKVKPESEPEVKSAKQLVEKSVDKPKEKLVEQPAFKPASRPSSKAASKSKESNATPRPASSPSSGTTLGAPNIIDFETIRALNRRHAQREAEQELPVELPAELPVDHPIYTPAPEFPEELDEVIPNDISLETEEKHTISAGTAFKLLFKALGWLFLTVAVLLMGWFAQWFYHERIAQGICVPGQTQPIVFHYPEILQPSINNDPLIHDVQQRCRSLLEKAAPGCAECPKNAHCTATEVICNDGYLLRLHPLSLGGILPVTPYCVRDLAKQKAVKQLAEDGRKVLDQLRADYECGSDGVDSPELSETAFYNEMYSQVSSKMSEEEFAEAWSLTTPLIENMPGIETREEPSTKGQVSPPSHVLEASSGADESNGFSSPELTQTINEHNDSHNNTDSNEHSERRTDNNGHSTPRQAETEETVVQVLPQTSRIYTSHSMRRISLTCSLRLRFLAWLKRHSQWIMQRLAACLAGYAVLRFIKSLWRKRRQVKTHKSRCIKALIAQQEVARTSKVPSYIPTIDLRENLGLKTWRKVQHAVESVPSVRVRLVEIQGEIVRVWEWQDRRRPATSLRRPWW